MQTSAPYWIYEQRNVRAVYNVDPQKGLSAIVFIQAPNAAIADLKAKTIGIYFDGVSTGIDCPCCGDRWARAEFSAATPEVFGFDPSGVYHHTDAYLPTAVEAFARLTALLPSESDPIAYIHRFGESPRAFERPAVDVIYA